MTKLKARRLVLKLTQQAVGYLASVSASDVSRIENRRMIPYPKQAEKIAAVLKMNPGELQKPARRNAAWSRRRPRNGRQE